jgi:hypothetical protein
MKRIAQGASHLEDRLFTRLRAQPVVQQLAPGPGEDHISTFARLRQLQYARHARELQPRELQRLVLEARARVDRVGQRCQWDLDQARRVLE